MANRPIELVDFKVDKYEFLRKAKKYRNTDVAVELGISAKTLQRYRHRQLAPRYIIEGLSRIFDIPESVLSDGCDDAKAAIHQCVKAIRMHFDFNGYVEGYTDGPPPIRPTHTELYRLCLQILNTLEPFDK